MVEANATDAVVVVGGIVVDVETVTGGVVVGHLWEHLSVKKLL